jgi:hypothetical protein
MIDKEAYTLRISTANPAQLVVINIELVIAFAENGQIEKAKDALDKLIRSLNFEIPLAFDFYEIYKYVNELLVSAQFSKDETQIKQNLADVSELMNTLLIGWKDAEKQVADLPPVVGETPKVYMGLTYSRDGLADEYIDDTDKKGFMA